MRFQNHHFMCLFLGFLLFMGICIPGFASEGPNAKGDKADDVCNLFSGVYLNSSQLTARQLRLLEIFQSKPTTVDFRMVEVDFNLLKKGKSINLNLFPDVHVLLKTHRIEKRSEQDYSWFGRLKQTRSHAILVVNRDEIVGTIRTGKKMYRIRPLGDGLHMIIQVDESAFPPDHPPEYYQMENSTHSHSTSHRHSGGFEGAFVQQTSTPTIKVLVAYTPNAESEVGNIDNLIQLAIDETNDSYDNSDITPRVELVHKYETNYTETGDMETDLERFREDNDGYMDEVHDRRNMYGADVAVLIGYDNYWYCGLASTIMAGESNAFVVVAQDCATGYYSFGHEIGHLQGARHNPEADSTNTPFAYGHGYYYETDSWRTVMSYNCPGGCTRIQYWSNPDITYGGVAMGTTATHDNARVLDETASIVSSFRAEADYGSTTVFDHAGGNTYEPAKSKVYVPKGLNIYTARLTGQGHNHDQEYYARVMRVEVNGNTYTVISWLNWNQTKSFSYTLPSGVLINGLNDIKAYIHWGNDYYDNGHWVSVDLELDTKVVNVSGYGTTTIFSNERGNTYNKAYARVNIPTWMTVANGKVTISGWGKNQDAENYVRTMRVEINGTTVVVDSWIVDGSTDSFSKVLNPALFHTGANDVYAYIHWGNDLYDDGHRLELKVTISQ